MFFSTYILGLQVVYLTSLILLIEQNIDVLAFLNGITLEEYSLRWIYKKTHLWYVVYIILAKSNSESNYY